MNWSPVSGIPTPSLIVVVSIVASVGLSIGATLMLQPETTSDAAKLPELVPSLLQALSHDKSGRARREAAETLGNFPDDPAVVQALEYAAKHDRDGFVRQRAQRTLRGMRGAPGSPR